MLKKDKINNNIVIITMLLLLFIFISFWFLAELRLSVFGDMICKRDCPSGNVAYFKSFTINTLGASFSCQKCLITDITNVTEFNLYIEKTI